MHEPPSVSPRVVHPSATIVALRGGGELCLDGSTATFRTPEPPAGDALVHPHLAVAAAGRNRLLGREVLHAGAVVVDGAAWALAGSNAAGKSTLLVTLAVLGRPVLSDDLLVVDGLTAFAGPRCADLRSPPARAGLPPSRPVRDGQRSRVLLPDAPAAAPLAGFVFLRWDAAGYAVDTLGAADRMRLLAPLMRWRFLPARPAGLLDLATLPAYEFRRPRDGEPATAAQVLLTGLAEHGG